MRHRNRFEVLGSHHRAQTGTPGGVRNDLSRSFRDPHFMHFATDIEGRRFVTDAGPLDERSSVFTAELGEPGEEPLRDWTYLLGPRSSPGSKTHTHPFLSPDGTMAFFNSDESGIFQAYMIDMRGIQGL